MTTFVLRTLEDRDVGFLCFARHEGDWPPAGPIDCVFMPFGAGDPEDQHDRFVKNHAGREWRAEVTYTPTAMLVRIALEDDDTLNLRSAEEGNAWEAVVRGEPLNGTGSFL